MRAGRLHRREVNEISVYFAGERNIDNRTDTNWWFYEFRNLRYYASAIHLFSDSKGVSFFSVSLLSCTRESMPMLENTNDGLRNMDVD